MNQANLSTSPIRRSRQTDPASGNGFPDRHSDDAGRMPARARTTARIVGILFLSGFLAYGIGSSIVTASGGDTAGPTFLTGAALMLLNSAIVIGIGMLMLPILRPHNKVVAAGYLATRIFEGVGLAIGVVSLLVLTGPAAIGVNFVAYNLAMAGLGIGSLFFRSGLVPRFLAGWGFLGCAFFASGSLIELSGVAGAGLVGAIPGGLFEVTFGVWLIVRGFRSTPSARRSNATLADES
jgi:hypothetical protein